MKMKKDNFYDELEERLKDRPMTQEQLSRFILVCDVDLTKDEMSFIKLIIHSPVYSH